jgi:hypothetical protein
MAANNIKIIVYIENKYSLILCAHSTGVASFLLFLQRSKNRAAVPEKTADRKYEEIKPTSFTI